MRSKLTHILAALTFAFSCFGLWAMLNVLNTVSGRAQDLPAFTTLIVGLREWLLVLPIPVAVYSAYFLVRRSHADQNGTTFLACVATVLSLVFFPV